MNMEHLWGGLARVWTSCAGLATVALLGGCDLAAGTAQSSGADLLSTLGQDVVDGIGAGLGTLFEVLVLRLFA
jgi:hypothetical protein